MHIYYISLVHIIGGTLYHYFNIEYALIPGLLFMAWNIYNYLKVSSLVLSPLWNVELEYDLESTLMEKVVLQGSSIITVALIYQAGYEYLSGMLSLYVITVLCSLALTGLDYDATEGEDDE